MLIFEPILTVLHVVAVLDFWEFYGPDQIRQYMYKMTQEAGSFLTKEWGTELLANPTFFNTMVMVRLPEGLISKDDPKVKMVDGEPNYDFSHGMHIGSILHSRYKIEVRTIYVAIT